MIRAFFLVFLTLGLIAGPAIADTGPGTKAVKAANDTISGLLKKKADKEKVTTSVRELIDLDELGKRALKDHWETIKSSEQDEYRKTLRALIEANYVKGMKANVDYKVEYTGETAADDGTILVNTIVKAKRKGRPLKIAVDYTLAKDAKGKLKVVDIATDGVGLVDNYRAQFNKIIAKDGIAGLLEKMKKKQAEAEAAAAETTAASKS
jgi:phospholipid transport system substrate-binding protein